MEAWKARSGEITGEWYAPVDIIGGWVCAATLVPGRSGEVITGVGTGCTALLSVAISARTLW